jgi:hypothetical protein
MRSFDNFHPEWGYLAPARSFARMLRIVVVATTVGATAGAAVVLSLVEYPAAQRSNTVEALVPAASSKTNSMVSQPPQILMPPQRPSAALSVHSGRVSDAIRQANTISAATQPLPGASIPAEGSGSQAPEETTINEPRPVAAASQAELAEEQRRVHFARKAKNHARIVMRRRPEYSARLGYSFESSRFFRTW